jgi:uncharacterized protein
MRMFIEASKAEEPQPESCRMAAKEAIRFLQEIADVRPTLEGAAAALQEPPLGSLPHVMWEAARLVGDSDLTPMASVAGTIADATADFLVSLGMTRVVVNNGGDLALRLTGAERLYVGIRRDIRSTEVTHKVLLTAEMGIGGVATSGLGGRSFTRGVASSATAFAPTCARADAAATALGNATCVNSSKVERCRAESIYPDTDLKGIEITRVVGELSVREIELALKQATKKAERMVAESVIVGACFFVKGAMRSTEGLLKLLEPVPIQE